MRYLDSGRRETSQALGSWLNEVMTDDVVETRWQSGFFSAGSLGLLQSSLQRMANERQPVHALIGSNQQSTSRRDVERLVAVLGIPRDNALLGVVSYRSGFYHPKTFHIKRSDGSQAAYVGSANLTGSGVASLHIEAGVTADTRDDDPAGLLNDIGAVIDHWFDGEVPGLYRVSSLADVERLVTGGILVEGRGQSEPVRGATGDVPANNTQFGLSRLEPLLAIPQLEVIDFEDLGTVEDERRLRSLVLPVAPRPDFPPYILFAPRQEIPTQGHAALSGASLPSNANGLIIRLNRDSARHFEGRPGTANISIPVAIVSTLRFGLFGLYNRPRAEIPIRIRFLGEHRPISVGPVPTNVMAYGYLPEETGHHDVRMLVPAVVRELAQMVAGEGGNVPGEGDMAVLEWPTSNEKHEFRLSFLERTGTLFRRAEQIFLEAQDSGSTVGDGACWLPDDLLPVWDLGAFS